MTWFWKKNDLIVFIYGLNFSFKTLLRVSKKKKMVKFFLRGLSSRVVDEIYIEVLVFQESSPALKNFLVASLGIYLSCSGRWKVIHVVRGLTNFRAQEKNSDMPPCSCGLFGQFTEQKSESFLWRISIVNLNRSVVFCGFANIY